MFYKNDPIKLFIPTIIFCIILLAIYYMTVQEINKDENYFWSKAYIEKNCKLIQVWWYWWRYSQHWYLCNNWITIVK